DRGKPDAVPMCGVPVHAVEPHLKRLAELGHRVAICEQVEDAKAAGRRLVRREVVEVVTPGLAGDPDSIEARRELVIAALEPRAALGLALLEATTGGLRATAVAAAGAGGALPAELREELRRVAPREILLPRSAAPELAAALRALLPDAAQSPVEPASYEPARAPRHPEGLAPDAADPEAPAAAALLAYLGAPQPLALPQVGRLRRYRIADAMVLDEATRAHLELFRSAEDGSRRHTLLERIARTATPLGRRRGGAPGACGGGLPLPRPPRRWRGARTRPPGSPSATACARDCARRCARCATSSVCSPRPRGRQRSRATSRRCATRSRRCPRR